MPLKQAIYASNATVIFTKEDLVALLNRARKNNRKLGLTGILLHKDGNFFQVIEGETENVDRKLAQIANDPRHSGVMHLLQRQIPKREFPSFSMAFREIGDDDLQREPGYSDLLNTEASEQLFRKSPSKALTLVAHFAKIVR